MRQHSQTQQPREKTEDRPSSASKLQALTAPRRPCAHQRNMSIATTHSLPRRHQRTPSDSTSPSKTLERRGSGFQRGHARKSSVVSIDGFLGDSTDDVAPNLLPGHSQLRQMGPASPFATIGWGHLDNPALLQRRGSLLDKEPVQRRASMQRNAQQAKAPSAGGRVTTPVIQEEEPHVSTLAESTSPKPSRTPSFLKKCATLFGNNKKTMSKTVFVK